MSECCKKRLATDDEINALGVTPLYEVTGGRITSYIVENDSISDKYDICVNRDNELVVFYYE